MLHNVRVPVSCLSRHLVKPSASRILASHRIPNRLAHSWSDVSPRNFAALENTVIDNVGASVVDPVLQKDLGSLKWLGRRILVSNDKANITLQLPSHLHPLIPELKASVQKSAQQEIEKWLAQHGYQIEAKCDVEVVTINSSTNRPQDVEKTLGPGLARVSQFLAVYSCKVSTNANSSRMVQVVSVTSDGAVVFQA